MRKIKRYGLLSVCLAAYLSFAGQVSALPILVSEWMGSNSGVATEANDVKNAINNYNSSHDPDLPLFSEATAVVIQAGKSGYITGGDEKVLTWTAPATYDYYYIMSKYGKGGANFDHALHYVLAGESLNYNPGGNSAPNGLSHVSIWGGNFPNTQPVPDGGSTVLLLGLAVGGLGAVCRRRR